MRNFPRPALDTAPWILILLVLLSPAGAQAQGDFSCAAEVNRTTVPRGENVVLTVSATGDMGWSADFRLPEIKGVRIQSGGTNQSMSVVNGKARTSVSRTWYLKVEQESDFTIGPVVVSAGGTDCRTEPIQVKVTAPLPPKTIPPANTGNRVPSPMGSGVDATDARSGQPGDDIFLTLDADFEEAWVGQQIILTFRYWRRVQPWNNPSYKAPRTEGFWREDLGEEKNYRKAVRGRAYSVTEIRYSLFPTRSGDLTIEPAELSFPEGVFDRFFNSRRSRRGPNILRTRSLVIKVRELPAPRPEGFSGIVASRLSLQANVDQDSVPRGEALGLKVTLVADGFLKGFSGLKITAPPETRMHDAAESFQSRPTHDRMSGMISLEKVLIPGAEGLLVIPPVELSWFDSRRGKYLTARADIGEVQVTPSNLPQTGDDSSGFLRSEISRLSEDLAFIHKVPGRLGRRSGPWLGSFGWWVVLLLPVLMIGLLRIYLNRLSADRRNPAGRRLRLSLVTARAELAKAPSAGDSPESLAGIARTVHGFVADCTDRPLAAVGVSEIKEYCAGVGLPATADRLVEILDACDSARYGGGRAGARGAPLVAEVEELLKGLDDARKAPGSSAGKTPGPVVGLLAGLALLTLAAPLTEAADQAGAGRPGADPVRLLAEGNQAYTSGETDQALALYLEARDLGANDAVLHFNLGNAYARRGELGQAVASYLRAQRLAPRDRDIHANLAWVRHHIKDLELTDEEWPLFIAQVAWIVSALTLDQWGVVLLVMVWLTAALVGWGWYREDFGVQLRRLLLTSAAGLLVVATVTAGRWHNQEIRNEAVVIVGVAEVKSGPADNFPVLFEVHDGLTVNIEGEREGWVRIGLGGEWRGWLPAGSVTPVRLERSSS
ncbi:MAG: BatD family protein [Candidatus Krumholzibacteriota bacterium]